jgi:hypothetical protein
MMPLAFVVSLLLTPAAEAAAPAAEAPAPAAATEAEAPRPVGAPADDYQFVAWCYGALAGYLEMHDEVMPEVTRIESTWRRPGSKLADDLKVYDAQQRQGRKDLKRFQAAITAAEKASMQPINVQGAAAVARGRRVWAAGPEVTKARKAQEWMSWTLPARCSKTADELEKRASLFGASLQANAPAEPAPAEPAVAPEPSPAPDQGAPDQAAPGQTAAAPDPAATTDPAAPATASDAPN